MFTLAKYPLINVREYWRASQKGQSREIGNIRRQRKKKQQKKTTQYVFDTTIRKQTQIT